MKSKRSTRDLIKEFLDKLICERGNRLVIFIDELDRCKPDYAIRFLERIKHYFDDDRVTFVFAVSLSQLQSTVKSYYGLECNATRYLDKFFDLRITLRSIDLESFMNQQLDVGGSLIFEDVLIEAAKYFNFSLREAERYGRMMKIASGAIKRCSGVFPDGRAKLFAACYIVPIMLALQMYDMELYNKFMTGHEPAPMVHKESQMINHKEAQNPIALSNRLEDVYSVLFSRPLEREWHEITIGNMEFHRSTRLCIEEIASMLSPQSDYQFE